MSGPFLVAGNSHETPLFYLRVGLFIDESIAVQILLCSITYIFVSFKVSL